MPKKQHGWITFQSSQEERLLLEQYCQQQGRTKTEVLRELVRSLNQLLLMFNSAPQPRQEHSGATAAHSFSKCKIMEVSARNTLKGTVKQVIHGAVSSEVTLEVAPGIEVVALITKASAQKLGLTEGKEAYAVIKATDVMVAVD